MDRFRAMETFVRVVEAGSFAGAAGRLDISVSAVSRQVAELEAHLATRLLHRTTRRLSLTEAGRAYCERALQILADVEEAERSAEAGTIAPRGTLRLSCSVTFGIRYLAPAVAGFAARHPDIRFDVELSDRAVDLVDEGFDLAVRIGPIGSQNLVGRRVATSRLVCCASPDYLARAGVPGRPEDLSRHACLSYAYLSSPDVWTFRLPRGAEQSVRIAGPLRANNGRFLVAMAVAGLGIAMEPDFMVGPDLAAGRLVRLLQEYEAPPSLVYVVYPSRRHLSAKVRAFADYLAQAFAAPEWAQDKPEVAGATES